MERNHNFHVKGNAPVSCLTTFLTTTNNQPAKSKWPSGLRRHVKAVVSSEAWVRTPPCSLINFFCDCPYAYNHNLLQVMSLRDSSRYGLVYFQMWEHTRVCGPGVRYTLRVRVTRVRVPADPPLQWFHGVVGYHAAFTWLRSSVRS